MNLKAFFLYFAILASLSLDTANGVEKGVGSSGTFNTTAPTSADIPNWDTGWGANNVTGWDYVGTVAGTLASASGVYVGNGWVITCGHVGPGPFTLGGAAPYQMVPGSNHTFGTADISLFQIYSPPSLPSLALASSTTVGSLTGMIGFGGGKSWGANYITLVDDTEMATGPNFTFTSTDFSTMYGGTTYGTNNYVVVGGDSGGGDFVYQSGAWQLTGLNEGYKGNDSYMVQLSSYALLINGVTGVPEPSLGWFVLGALVLIWKWRLSRPRPS